MNNPKPKTMKYWQQKCSKDGTTVDFDHAKATWLMKMALVALLAFNGHTSTWFA